MSRPLLTAEDVAEELGLHARTVRRHIREGRLEAQKVGKSWRITREAMSRYAGLPEAPSVGAPPRHVDASTIVEIEGISRAEAMRMTDGIVAASNGRRGDAPALRVETVYDEARQRRKVVCLGGVGASIAVLGLIELYTGRD